MIFGLRRYIKILKIYCKNYVILNIHIFHSRDATIRNSIEKSLKIQLKNQLKLIEKRVQNQTPCRESFLEPFWSHFGLILTHFRPEIVYLAPRVVQNGFQEASGTQLRFSLIVRLSSRSSRRQRAAPFADLVASRRNQ